tara:strand:- start:1646 stop:2074 length:429 start_codon:yes stop_codon:yes gene_type:complete
MATKIEQILAQLKTSLTGTAKVAKRIYRSRPEAITKAESPAVLLEPVSCNAANTESFLNQITWELRVRISVISRGNIPDKIADPTVESLYKKVLADPTVNNLAIDIKPEIITYEIIEADGSAAIVSCEFEIQFRSSYNDLSV